MQMHDIIYLAVEQMLCPVQAQIFRDDADAVLEKAIIHEILKINFEISWIVISLPDD